MAQQSFRVISNAGMWLRSQPIAIDETRVTLLPKGQLVTKVADTEKPDWWRIRVVVEGKALEGFSNSRLMAEAEVSVPSGSRLFTQTLTVVRELAPQARENYLDAIAQGGPLFERHGLTTPQRIAHFLAQTLHETGAFTILRENMNYTAERLLEIFGVGRHSARITPQEARTLERRPVEIAERVYGFGNPRKAEELGNTQPGDGFFFRGNGVLQTTGRGNHRRMGLACGIDFEGNPNLVVAPEHALKPALQEWTEGDLNAAADVNDIETITRVINGGFNGLSERRAFFERALPLLDA